MHKVIQAVLLMVGVILIGYGIYSMIAPGATDDLGIVEVDFQDENNNYLTIGFGIAAVVLSLLTSRKR